MFKEILSRIFPPQTDYDRLMAEIKRRQKYKQKITRIVEQSQSAFFKTILFTFLTQNKPTQPPKDHAEEAWRTKTK